MHTTTMTRTYSASEVRRLTGVTIRELDYWARTGVATPSAIPLTGARGVLHPVQHLVLGTDHVLVGSGNSRSYTDVDVARINALKLLRTAGIELSRLRHEDLSALRADIAEAFLEADRTGLCG